jgi:hypothetical protein
MADVMPPVIHISPMGNLGNRAVQYLAARALAARVGDVRFSAISLPPFGITHPPVGGEFPGTEIVTSNTVDLDRLARALLDGTLQRVDLRTYAQRIENFLPPAAYRDELTAQGPAWAGSGADELLCNIRQGDILDARHPDYVLIPVDFYADLVEETGLTPVFMGQLEDSPYLRQLRRRFPRARFLPSRGPSVDFERIRRARHIVPSISTFSWLAAWLSNAQRIYMPVLGLLHPMQNRAVNLLPLDDPRFRFYYFPIHYAAPVAATEAAQAALRGMWRFMPPDRLATLLARQPPPRQKHLYVQVFDETFYRAIYPDIAAAIRDGHWPDGRSHYETTGYTEGRAGFALDRAWYCRRYPIAAVEIAEGQFHDADHHWLEAGRDRGYARGPAQP